MNKVRVRPATNNLPKFRPGQRAELPSSVRGGGGPANAGARTTRQGRSAQYIQIQPSWTGEFADDFFGAAAPTNTPVTAGVKRDNFRELGDLHGGRG